MDWLVTTGMSAAAGAWSSHAGLGSDTGGLRAVLPRVHALIDRAGQLRFTNPGVADLLVQLKDAAYDAEDLLDELATQEGGTPFSSVCAFVHQLVAGTADKVKDVHARLDFVSAEMERAIKELGTQQHGPMPLHASRETSSFLGSSLVVGRDREREEVIQVLLNSANPHQPGGDGSGTKRRKRCDGLAVLPIVGIGGVGKTTLAQVVYNDPRVQEHFGLRMWVYLPELLDVMLVTKEIIESATKGASVQSSLRNLDTVQGILKDLVVSRRFLLVLDNAWREDSEEWRRIATIPGGIEQFRRSGS